MISKLPTFILHLVHSPHWICLYVLHLFFLDFAWQGYSDQSGSDNFPIFTDIVKSMPKDNVPHWNLKKADWPKFKHQCTLDINMHSFTLRQKH